MTATPFPTLFSPLIIGGVRLRNRIVSTGHDTVMAEAGQVTDRLIAYHRARAQGGAGLIVTQVAGVHETARYTSHILMLTEDGAIPGFARLAQAVKAEGAAILGQLFHPGREIMETADGTQPVAYAPSAVPNGRFRVMPVALDERMIAEIIAGYGAAAARLMRAGFDGCEIVASHGYLPAQFLNPAVNLRSDRWGGALPQRARFLIEVAAAIRAATAPGFVISLRISGEEHDDTAMAPDEVVELCRLLDAAATVDVFHVIAGTSASLAGAIHIVPPMYYEPGYTAPFAAAVKAAVARPVIVTGRINQPQAAERILAQGQADACGMTRALICDPQMPAKAQAGRGDDIRACIGCNQACIGHFHKGYPISCIQHPETGRELTLGAPLQPAARRRRVLVAGGGPAGLKAAAVLAGRGHEVTLHEAGPLLGGQANLAQLLPGRAEFGGIVTNLAREAAAAGVSLRLNSAVDLALVRAEAPDLVVIATGARPRHPPLPGDGAQVVDAWAVLRGQVNPGGAVAIADWRGDWIGLGLAERLLREGRSVRLYVEGIAAGESLPFYVRDAMVARVQRLGGQIIPYARLYGAEGNSVVFTHSAGGDPLMAEGVETLVLAQGHEADTTLARALQDWPGEVHLIGDALTPRSAEEAVLDGLRLGRAI
jgi:2,4-dienoyl-CoA reductase-like NADH-dependent reductase (Old Yellow Enzyme family)